VTTRAVWRPLYARRVRIAARIFFVLVPLALAVPAAGVQARTAHLSAVGLRIGAHPTFVRVVVDLAGGSIIPGIVEATDPNPIDGRARLVVRRPGASSFAAPLNALGVRASVTRVPEGLAITLDASLRRFKYLEYSVLHGPERLVLDLWTSAPPPPGAGVFRGRNGCLTLERWSVHGGVARASGRERFLFEHSFVLRLRNARGVIVAQKPVTATGRWSASVRHRMPRQPGTLEVVALSAKDGSLDCLVQARVVLG
jgi:hypothetical protein